MPVKESRKTRYTLMVLKDSLIELMTDKPISKITIKEICENADINRTTFYTHFENQYDLLRQIEEESLAELRNVLDQMKEKENKDDLREVLTHFLQFIHQNNHSIQVLMSDKGDRTFQTQLVEMAYSGVSQYSPVLRGRASEADEYKSIFVTTGSIGVIQRWMQKEMQTPIDEMVDILLSLA